MKNIQIIDGARNSVFEIYAIDDETFGKIFGNEMDVVFLSDLTEYLDYDKPEIQAFWLKVYSKKMDKRNVNGIHGTLHLDSSYCEKSYFPERKEKLVINRYLLDE
ncbi:hypothetical protein [Desulforamulus aeronauticus]|uniref:Uncharacterized protein n=1 Tax=Desulforamulus aeronauticus DSM 10349 TaxID=1121421 RepID=A0A1M6XE41_9FIRM|nr:hypothetical protein [Desulforamulus aeronauticus]SHL04188.1 hypothetical protein SAMN02745123_03996 [Desulforamulus aeronauticus DSM 10349]